MADTPGRAKGGWGLLRRLPRGVRMVHDVVRCATVGDRCVQRSASLVSRISGPSNSHATEGCVAYSECRIGRSSGGRIDAKQAVAAGMRSRWLGAQRRQPVYRHEGKGACTVWGTSDGRAWCEPAEIRQQEGRKREAEARRETWRNRREMGITQVMLRGLDQRATGHSSVR